MNALLKPFVCIAAACLASMGMAAETSSRVAASPDSAISPSQGQQQAYYDAKTLMDTKVKNPEGQDLGEIHNVLFNPEKSEFFATVEVGSGRYAVVPWKALTITSQTGTSLLGGSKTELHITMNTTKEALKAAPTLSKDQEQNLNNPSFLQTVYQHYKLQPPSAMGGSSESSTGGSISGGSSLSDTNTPAPK